MTAQSPSADRIPPHSEDAEEAVLSAILIDPSAIATVRASLAPEAFYRMPHRHIYRAMLALNDAQTVIDPLTLSERLGATGELAAAGGKEFLGYLTDAVPTASNVGYHAAIVQERAAQRDLIGKLEAAARLAWDRTTPAEKIAQQLVADFLPLAAPKGREGFVEACDLVYDVLKEIEARAQKDGLVGVPTGYTEIDDVSGGWRDELVGFCGVPKSGKSILAMNFALNNVIDGIDIGIVTIEMSSKAYLERMLVVLSHVEARAVRNGRLDSASFGLLMSAAQRLRGDRGGRLFLDETPAPSFAELVARCRALKTKHPTIRAIYVDYLQLIEAEDETRAEAIRQVTRGLQQLAKELGIPIIVLAQLNDKNIEARADKRPLPSDVQGSSGLRQDASYLGLLYRGSMYSSLSSLDMLDISFAVARNAGQFEVRLECDMPHLTIRSPRNFEPAASRQEELIQHV